MGQGRRDVGLIMVNRWRLITKGKLCGEKLMWFCISERMLVDWLRISERMLVDWHRHFECGKDYGRVEKSRMDWRCWGEQKLGKQGWAMTLNDRRESHQEGNGRSESHYDYGWEEKKT
jgi:hypothetical protein